MLELGEKPFRGNQIFEWLWKKNAQSFEEMHNLPKSLRAILKEHFVIQPITIADEQHSTDGTVKCAFQTKDNRTVEGVLIPTDSRLTACISSQVGCSLSCKFCATGRLKRMRNLTGAEIVDQVVHISQQCEQKFGRPLTNIVYMGMGEPLLNYKEMMFSIDRITSEDGLNISPKRITVSTAGIAKMIRKLGDDGVKFNLALSLHAANDVKRSEIMAINDQNNLDELADALNYFYSKTRNRITFEYILLNGFNDTLQDARELIGFCKKVPSKVNIIEYNPIDGGEFEKSDEHQTDQFVGYLERHNVVAKVRRSRGKDIDAACGQLANKNEAVEEVELKS